jgi:hypothetical protein
MIRTLATEAVVVAKRMIRTLAAEPVVLIVVAQAMAWAPVAQIAHFDHLETERMMCIPATKMTGANVLKRRVGADLTIAVVQRPREHGRRRRRDDRCARRNPGENQCADYDNVQQHAACRSKSSHLGHPMVEYRVE